MNSLDGAVFLGTVVRFDAETLVAEIALEGKLCTGDTILIKKGDVRVVHKVESITIGGISVEKGFIGDLVDLVISKS